MMKSIVPFDMPARLAMASIERVLRISFMRARDNSAGTMLLIAPPISREDVHA